MSDQFISWPEIHSLPQVKTTVDKHSDVVKLSDGTLSPVTYRGKIKLHGTNFAIQVFNDRTVCQSRNKIITPEDDNSGAAAWAEGIKHHLISSRLNRDKDFILYAEFSGKGIMSGVACSSVDRKFAAVFCIREIEFVDNEMSGRYIFEPDEILSILTFDGRLDLAPDLLIIPWYDEPTQVNLIGDTNKLKSFVESINEQIEIIEKEDPFIKTEFGISGCGEGLVFYPISHSHNPEPLFFKAKGEKHRVKKDKEAVVISSEVINSVTEFAQTYTTEARLLQGAIAMGADSQPVFDQKLIGKFIGWVSQDVAKECKEDLEASALEWKLVSVQVTGIARKWYLLQIMNQANLV